MRELDVVRRPSLHESQKTFPLATKPREVDAKEQKKSENTSTLKKREVAIVALPILGGLLMFLYMEKRQCWHVRGPAYQRVKR